MMRVYNYVYASGRVVRVKADEASLFDVFAASPGLYRIDEYNPRTGAFMRAYGVLNIYGRITLVQLDGDTDYCGVLPLCQTDWRICGGWMAD